MPQRAISIVIPNYNDERTLGACIESVLSKTNGSNWRLIVVDAGSSDGSHRILEGFKDPRLEVVTRGRMGAAAALNVGFARAGGDDVVRLHGDVVIETQGWLAKLEAAAYGEPKAGVVGVRLVYPDGRIQSEGRTLISGVGMHPQHCNNRAFQPDGAAGPISEVDSVSGALAYYRREVLADTGGLDENYGPAWVEDDDFCVAARHRNYKVYVHAGVTAVHHTPAPAPTLQFILPEAERPLQLVTSQMKAAAERRLAEYWEKKWGWNPYYPDLGEVRRLYSKTEICWRIGEALRYCGRSAHPTVDCCIVTWNTVGLLRRCLESLAQTDYPADRLNVFVADNSSTDGTLPYLDGLEGAFPFPLRVIRLPVNTGAAVGINFAMAAGCGELVARLDDDLTVPPGWLKPLVADLAHRPFAGCVGPKIINDDSRQAIQCGGYRHFPVFYGHEDEPDLGQADYLARTAHVRGCCNLYRRDALARCGMMDVRYSPTQCDDPDHHIALIAAGYEILYDGRVRVVHKLNNGVARSHAALANHAANKSKMTGKWGRDIYEVLERSIDFSREGRYLPGDGDTSAWMAEGHPPGDYPRRATPAGANSPRQQVLFNHYDELRKLARGSEVDQLAATYVDSAGARARDGYPRAGLDLLLCALNFAPQNPAVLRALARAYGAIGQPDLGRLAARRGRALVPSDPELKMLAEDGTPEAGSRPCPADSPGPSTASAARMRVLMVANFEPRAVGADTSRMQETRTHLGHLGVHADFCCTPCPDPAGYDVVHFWNTGSPHQTLAQVKAVRVRRPSVPLVLSPAYWEGAERAWADQAIPEIFARSATMDALNEKLRLLSLDQLAYGGATRNTAPEPFHRGYRLYQRRIFELVDHLLPGSRAELQSLKTSLGIDLPHTVVPRAVDTAAIDDATADWFVREYGVRDFVLTTGMLEPRRNLLMLLHALKGTHLPAVVVGRTCDPSYGALCRRHAPPGTLFIEHLQPEGLASALKASRVYALPSWTELESAACLEAASCGCAVVASDRTSDRECLGGAAYYCDPASINSIREAVLAAHRGYPHDRARRAALQETIRSRFTWPLAAQATLRGYEAAVAARARAVPDALGMPLQSVA